MGAESDGLRKQGGRVESMGLEGHHWVPASALDCFSLHCHCILFVYDLSLTHIIDWILLICGYSGSTSSSAAGARFPFKERLLPQRGAVKMSSPGSAKGMAPSQSFKCFLTQSLSCLSFTSWSFSLHSTLKGTPNPSTKLCIFLKWVRTCFCHLLTQESFLMHTNLYNNIGIELFLPWWLRW